MFDFNGDGETDLTELWIAYNLYEESIEEEENGWRDDCEDGSEYGLDSEDFEDETDYEYAIREADGDDSEYDLDPEDYETEEEYGDALEDAKDDWREYCEDGSGYDVDPEDYETEEEYEEALEDDEYGWREYCEDGSEYDVDPEDYETEEEYEEALKEAKYGWREYCEDGSEYDVDPEDYETEEEYEKALEEAKYAWRDDCEDGSEYDLDPEDYETEEEYEEALEEAIEEARQSWRDRCKDGSKYNLDPDMFQSEEAYNKALEEMQKKFPTIRRFQAADALCGYLSSIKVKKCCQFIVDHADDITAANYLSHRNGFLYAQAVKEHFDLPVSLPDEDERQECQFAEVLYKIAQQDAALSFEVWAWCLTTFLPYAQYSMYVVEELTNQAIDEIQFLSKDYMTELARYMDQHPDFMQQVMHKDGELALNLDALIAAALRDGLMDTGYTIFQRGLQQAGRSWRKINNLVRDTILACKNYDELESAEYFKLHMLPLVRNINMSRVQAEIERWEKDLNQYIRHVEEDCERYVYTRKNTWRKTAPDGSAYGLDPCDYDSEKKYLKALNEKKEEYCESHKVLQDEKCPAERRQWQQQQEQQGQQTLADDTVYLFCGVLFPNALHPYYYRTADPLLKIGDQVLVPARNREAVGKIVSVGQYLRVAAPFPVDKAKFIRSKVEEEDN